MGFFEFNILTQNAFNKYNGNFELSANDEKTNAVFKKLITIFDENNDNKLSGKEIQKIWKEIKIDNMNSDSILDDFETIAYINRNKDKFVSSTECEFNGLFFKVNKTLISPKELTSFLNYIYDSIGESANGKENFVPTTLPIKEQYSLETLKKKFPEKYFEIKHTGPFMHEGKYYTDGEFSVRNKKNNRELIEGYLYNNESFEPQINYKSEKYSIEIIFNQKNDIKQTTYPIKTGTKEGYMVIKNGEVYKLTINEIGEPEIFPILDEIHKIFNDKYSLGFKTTVTKLDKFLNMIDEEDFKEILLQYRKKYKKDLLLQIKSEKFIDKKTKEKLLKRFNTFIANDESLYDGSCIVNKTYSPPNCKIDNQYNQGATGDCWFLSAIAAINAKPEGAKLLNNMITKQEDGSFKVKFLGAKKSYTVTPTEIYTNIELAEGDLDVRILEIAAKKHFNILGIDGGNHSTALDLILGSYKKALNDLRHFAPFANTEEELKEIIKDPNMAVTTGLTRLTKFGYYKSDIDDFNSFIKKFNPLENFKIAKTLSDYDSNHAYAVVDIDDEFVYLQNPHWVKSSENSAQAKEEGKDIKVPIDLFQRIFHNIQYSKIPSEYIYPPSQ